MSKLLAFLLCLLTYSNIIAPANAQQIPLVKEIVIVQPTHTNLEKQPNAEPQFHQLGLTKFGYLALVIATPLMISASTIFDANWSAVIATPEQEFLIAQSSNQEKYRSLMRQAIEAYEYNKFNDAIKLSEQAMTFNLRDSNPYFWIAKSQLRLKKSSEAKQTLYKGIEQSGDNAVMVRLLLAEILMDEYNWTSAAKVMETFPQDDPSVYASYSNLAIIYFELDDLAASFEAIQRYRELLPTSTRGSSFFIYFMNYAIDPSGANFPQYMAQILKETSMTWESFETGTANDFGPKLMNIVRELGDSIIIRQAF